MLARLMLHQAGLMKKAWRMTLRRPASLGPEAVETMDPPLWPSRYAGSGLSLFTAEASAPTRDPIPSDASALSAHLYGQGRAASYLISHAA